MVALKSKTSKNAPPAIEKVFAIGDVHGCASELKLLLNKLPIDSKTLVVFLGDYVDRGSQSREVIETLISLKKSVPMVTLMGNHESMFLDFLKDPASEQAAMFVYNGGSATLASYGDNDGKYQVPDSHIEFLLGLDLYCEWKEYFFVHAGVPEKPLKEMNAEDRQSFLWIRSPFLESGYHWEKMIVHGHTPVKEVEFTPHRIGLDTGCVFNNKLTALELPSKKLYSVAKRKKVQHVYLRDQGSNRVAVRFEGVVPVYVQSGETLLEFETINYSEFGVLIKDIVRRTDFLFAENQSIRGEIGSQNHNLVQFEGNVVRRTQEPDGFFSYGVKIQITGQSGFPGLGRLGRKSA